MAYTYSKIASVTVGSGGVSTINFLTIPQNYTDLMMLISAKTNRSATGDNLWLRFNNDDSSSYSTRRVYGSGTGTGSDTGSTSTWINVVEVGDSGTNTTGLFGSSTIYIPNYTGINYKSVSADATARANQSEVYLGLNSGLWSKSSPVTSITLAPQIGTLINEYSTFTLYGIKAEV